MCVAGSTDHQRDVFAEIWKKVKEHRVKDASDFEWLKQTRLYWNNDTESALISIADVEFSYCYEYLGVKERLAITPLTDRQVGTLRNHTSVDGGALASEAVQETHGDFLEPSKVENVQHYCGRWRYSFMQVLLDLLPSSGDVLRRSPCRSCWNWED